MWCKMQDYKQLQIWQKAMDFAVEVNRLTGKLPDSEKYGLSSQISRASSSISANIAEGCGRRTSKDFANFLYIAMGSLKETESHLLLAQRIGYLSAQDVSRLLEQSDSLGKQLNVFIGKVRE